MVTVDLRQVPEVLWEMRHQLAQILRVKAGAEADPRVAKRLREVAAAFETGEGAVARG